MLSISSLERASSALLNDGFCFVFHRRYVEISYKLCLWVLVMRGGPGDAASLAAGSVGASRPNCSTSLFSL